MMSRGLLPASSDCRKAARARVGDGAQVLDHFVAGHAEAGVADGQVCALVVRGEPDGQFGFRVEHVAIGQHLELQAVQGVGGVGDQLAQEDLAVGVERVDQDMQQLPDFGAETERFGAGGGLS